MKLTDKRFWMLVIVIASAAVASAQAVFSVEEISYVEYADAEKEYSRFNVIPADTIPDNEIVNMVLKESQTKFERLDSFTRRDIYDFVEGFGINKQRLLYFPELKLYGFVIPDNPFDDSVWWFDAESGRYLCDAASPTAINANGIYVSQTGHDCDWPLDLRFFRRAGDMFYEFESYKNTQFNGETIFWQQEDDELRPVFWHDNSTLYLKTYDHKRQQGVYLKIKVQQSVRNFEKGGKR
jgi:hypothetical protein